MSAILRKFAPKEETPDKKKHELGPMHHKPLMLRNRGLLHTTYQIFDDLYKFIPHSKKESAVPPDEIRFLDITAKDRHCDTIVLFEAKHRKVPECYMWVACAENGPTISFYLKETQSMSELKGLGNCLRGSRPLIFFDPSFNDNGIYEMSKLMLKRMFSVPYQDKHAKPFVDHTISFYRVKNNIIMRHYQIQWNENDDEEPVLVEIGPRIKMVPVVVLAGTFKGNKIWENLKFESPYKKQKKDRIAKSKKKLMMRDMQADREEKKLSIPKEENPMNGLFD